MFAENVLSNAALQLYEMCLYVVRKARISTECRSLFW